MKAIMINTSLNVKSGNIMNMAAEIRLVGNETNQILFKLNNQRIAEMNEIRFCYKCWVIAEGRQIIIETQTNELEPK